MADNDLKPLKKTLASKKKLKSHTYVKDNDLQIHISTIKDANVSHRIPNFKLYRSAAFERYEMPFLEKSQSHVAQSDSLKLAMDEARSSFDSMMLIREQLNHAYHELIQKQQ